jgi:hypothetical protein
MLEFLNSETMIWSKNAIFVISRNNLNEFWDLYNGTNLDPRPLQVAYHYIKNNPVFIINKCFFFKPTNFVGFSRQKYIGKILFSS